MGVKIVLDTNVLISGLIVENGPSGKILDAIQKGDLALITSGPLLQEFAEVVSRPHIIRKYPKVTEHAEAILDYLRTHATLFKINSVERVVDDDPDDDLVIASAIAGEAEYIVSGDEHLLALAQHGAIRIIAPAEFVAIVFQVGRNTNE